LGAALQEQGKLGEAAAQCQRALALKPDFAAAHNNLGFALQRQGKLSEAVAQYQRALALKPDYAEAHSSLLFCLIYNERLSANEIHAAHHQWEVRHARGRRRPSAFANDRSAGRRLKVGYVSGDFRQHSVAWFFGPF